MTIKAAILATIAAEPKQEIQGRTLLYKKLYFLSVLAGEDIGFSPYFYGPYSSVVSDELGALVQAGFVTEESDRLGGYDRLGQMQRYRYKLSDDAREVIERYGDDLARYRPWLERMNEHPVSRNLNLLAVASKVHLIQTERGGSTVEDVQERAREYGWNIGRQEVQQVARFLRLIEDAKGGALAAAEA